MNTFKFYCGKKVYFDEETNRHYILEKKTSSNNYRRRYGEIKTCKECGNEFFTNQDSEFCCKICMGIYVEIIDINIVDGLYVYVTSNLDYFIYTNEYGKYRKRYGFLKNCKFCGKLFFAHKEKTMFCSNSCKFSGENSYSYVDGNTDLKHLMRTSTKYKTWRKNVMTRDEHTCKNCGCKSNLDVHHIVTVEDIFETYEIEDILDMRNCEFLWDEDNGITLCRDCHIGVHNGSVSL